MYTNEILREKFKKYLDFMSNKRKYIKNMKEEFIKEAHQ